MKSFTTLLLITGAAFSTHATIRTVSNDPQNPAQFTTVQAAVNAAVAGDTIYVNASNTIYSENVSVTKRLVLIGGGYKSSSQLNFRTFVNRIDMPFLGSNNPSGTVITGFEIGNIASATTGSLPISNIRIFRNLIGSLSTYGSNWEIYNNILTGTLNLTQSTANIFVRNNIFASTFISGSSTGPASTLIDHNIFLESFGQALNNLQNATLTNNIFAFSSTSAFVIDGGTRLNTFNNNLCSTVSISNVPPTNSFSSNANLESGNLVGVNPQFINVPNFANYDANANYRLQTGSPARNAGTDGTDLGIYGGLYPFPSGGAPGSGFDTSAFPPIPQVTSLNIQNSNITPGTQLRVQIQATTNN